jgi:hypothetical protein
MFKGKRGRMVGVGWGGRRAGATGGFNRKKILLIGMNAPAVISIDYGNATFKIREYIVS